MFDNKKQEKILTLKHDFSKEIMEEKDRYHEKSENRLTERMERLWKIKNDYLDRNHENQMEKIKLIQSIKK